MPWSSQLQRSVGIQPERLRAGGLPFPTLTKWTRRGGFASSVIVMCHLHRTSWEPLSLSFPTSKTEMTAPVFQDCLEN